MRVCATPTSPTPFYKQMMATSCLQASEHRARWTWEDGVQGEDGEWTEKPSLVLTKATSTRRRLRRHSLASSVGSGSTSTTGFGGLSLHGTTLHGGSFPRLEAMRKADEARTVTLEDVKAVAVRYISTGLLEKMKRSTVVTFDEFYRTDAMNQFLWSVLLYHNAFTMHEEASSDENIKVPGALGEEARKALRMAEEELDQASVNLGEQYSRLNTGQSHASLHHTCKGSLRASRTHRDQHLYEVIYEFAMFVTWITFGYKDWNSIHKELGRLFKTQAFNRDVRVRGEATTGFFEELGCKMDRKSDEYLSYRVFYDRPPRGNLRDLRSPALKSYFASPKERHMWAFEPPYHPKSKREAPMPTSERPPEKLGVIGEQMSKVNPDNLRYKEEEEDEDEEEGEGEDGEGEDDFIPDTGSVMTCDSEHQD
ncbi:Protein phosphatase 1 regulatory subunit 36 [Geodia barretti]|uniref:Protein phosphatase 1 regulatory subunit 36 n=1 Tax=Geodia barretti TaxID=519541 RepID=A0AA35S100_GEOBA|nr:Protein phosphatase 1 regulatory subunit 36 [Geodia barretti]